jgi:hypothetical protein
VNILSRLTDLSRQIAGATQSAQESTAALRAQINSKREELRRVQTAFPPKNEVKEIRCREIRETAAAYSAEDPIRFVRAIQFTPRRAIEWRELCALAGPVVEEAVCDAIDRAEYVPGPPAAERPGMIARLERELAELEGAEERAIDEAAAAGVSIAHRPEVITRRQREAGDRASLEKWQAGVRERQVAVDQRAATRRSVTTSAYLSSVHRHGS